MNLRSETSYSSLGQIPGVYTVQPYCLDKLPNTESEGCPITHLPRCICAIRVLFNPLQHVSEARDYFFMQKSDAHRYS